MPRFLHPLSFPVILLAATLLQAQAGLLVPTSSGRPDDRVLALREMTIDVGLARGYARVNVRQVFETARTLSRKAPTALPWHPRPPSAISPSGTASNASRA